MINKNIDITKFKKIENWELDNYTEYYTVWLSGRSLSYDIHKNVKIDGNIRKGSYICVVKGIDHKITSATIITQTKFNKLQKERN